MLKIVQFVCSSKKKKSMVPESGVIAISELVDYQQYCSVRDN